MSSPAVRWLDLPAGRFRCLAWAGGKPGAIFLHGLTGVAEVWGPTVEALGDGRPECLALDQRGHGHSAKPRTGYAVGDFVGDLLAAMDALGLEQPHLVGHSMGARVAMVAAARYPERFRSVAIVDIGPEEWKANHVQTVAAFERMPVSWPDVETAIGGSGRTRDGGSLDAEVAARPAAEVLRGIATARLRTLPDGSVTWLADREALKQTVVTQRSRNYWREWERLRIPALYVRGGASTEVRPAVAARMQARNPAVDWVEFAGAGHNVPLIAPGLLAETLSRHWRQCPGSS
ncbi:MAG: alpha/beta hydrolase [Chloroflexi bacterium]|nr:alpha/beta hydrolase [Chloroflexota bacterium]